MILRVEDLVRDAFALEECAQHFIFFNRHGTNQHRLAFFIELLHALGDGVQFAFFGLKDEIVLVVARDLAIGRHFHRFQAVHFVKFFGGSFGGTGHARELAVHAEEILVRDARNRA